MHTLYFYMHPDPERWNPSYEPEGHFAADQGTQDDADGLAPWPRLGMGCLYERQAMEGVIEELGLPCLEGGSVAIRDVVTNLGAWHCMIFYGRQTGLPPQQEVMTTGHTDELALQMAVRQTINQCLPGTAEIISIPIPLAEYASCIANVNLLNGVEDLYIPIRGSAVLPYRAGPRRGARLSPVYSDFSDPFGHIQSTLKTVGIRISDSSRAIAVLDLSVVVLTAL